MIPPYPLEDPSSDFAGILAQASGQVQADPSPESFLGLALAYMLCGRLKDAEAALDSASRTGDISNSIVELINFAQDCIRCDQFERKPGEIAVQDMDTDLAKAKVGFVWPMTSLPEEAGLHTAITEALRQHRKARDWRVLRNLLGSYNYTQGSNSELVNHFFQSEIAFCQKEASNGLTVPTLAGAGFYRQLSQDDDVKKWTDLAFSTASRSDSPSDQAKCLLISGDFLSAQYSSPLTWNFASIASYGNPASNLLDIVEDAEFPEPWVSAFDEAVEKYILAKDLFEKGGNQRGLGHIAIRMGYIAFLGEKYKDIEKSAVEALEHFEKAGDLCHALLAETHLAIALACTHQMGKALEIARKIGTSGRQNGLDSWTMGLGQMVARCARHFVLRMYDAEKSVRLFHVAKALQTAANNKFAAAQHEIDLAKVYESTGQMVTATNHYLEGIARMEVFISEAWNWLGDKSPLLMTSLQISNLCYANINIGIQKTNPVGIDRWLKTAQNTTSLLHQKMEQIDDQYRQFILAQLDSFKDLEGIAKVSSAIYTAKKSREVGGKEEVIKNLKLAKSTLSGLNLSPDTRCLLNVKIYAAEEDWPTAQDYARQYVALLEGKPLPEVQGVDWNTMPGQFLNDLTDYRNLNRVFGLMVRTRLYQEARVFLEKLEEVYGADWWAKEDKPWFEASDIGEMWEGLGYSVLAQEWYDKSLERYEAYRNSADRNDLRVAMADVQNMVYTIGYAARAAFINGQPEMAFRYAELGKARALLDLAEEIRTFGDTSPEIRQLLFKLRELDARFASCQYELNVRLSNNRILPHNEVLKNNLENIEESRRRIEREILDIDPGFYDKGAAISHGMCVEGVAEKLEEDTLLVSYFFSGDALFLWAIARSGQLAAIKRGIKEWQLKSWVYGLREAVKERMPNWEEFAVRLSENLLEPIANLLRQYHRIVFVPHGALQGLPFHILSLGGEVPIGLTHSISYLPAAGALSFIGNGMISPDSGVLAVGNPTGDLRAATAEARFVGSLFPESAAVLLHEEATESAVRGHLSGARLLHFATHGNISEDNPMASALSLAHGEQLSVQDLMGVELNAELVVLSACNSGQGNQTAGDDLLGLSRALIAGGAQAAVLTYWPVEDLATSLWVRHFYLELKRGFPAAAAARAAQGYLYGLSEESLEEALNQIWGAIDPGNTHRTSDKSLRATVREIGFTKAETPRDYRHPYYWGAFSVLSR